MIGRCHYFQAKVYNIDYLSENGRGVLINQYSTGADVERILTTEYSLSSQIREWNTEIDSAENFIEMSDFVLVEKDKAVLEYLESLAKEVITLKSDLTKENNYQPNLNEVLEGDKPIYEAMADNVLTNAIRNNNSSSNSSNKTSRISKILKSLSQYGMNYDAELLKNMRAIPADKALISKEDQFAQQSLYGAFTQWKVKSEEDKKFSEKTLYNIIIYLTFMEYLEYNSKKV